MRALKIGLSALAAIAALIAGLFVAALLAVGSGLYFLLRGSRQRAPRPPLPRPSAAHPRSDSRAAPTDVIDVTATEVRAERS